MNVDAMMLLASKGIRPVTSATAGTEAGVWYMDLDGWRKHGSDVFRPYDRRQAVNMCRPKMQFAGILRGSLVTVLLCAALYGLFVVGAR